MPKLMRRRSRSGNRKRRTYEWTAFRTSPDDDYDIPGSIVLPPNAFLPQWLMSPPDAQFFFDEPVIERLLVRLTAITTASTAELGTDNIGGVLNAGIIVWKSDENEPNSLILAEDGSKDWLWHEDWCLYKAVGESFGVLSVPATGGLYQGRQDLRARRRIPDGSGLAMVVGTSANLTHDIRMYVSGRILWSHA